MKGWIKVLTIKKGGIATFNKIAEQQQNNYK